MPALIIALLFLCAATAEATENNFDPPDQTAMDFAANYSKDNRGQSLIVLYDGNLIFERYDNGGDANRYQMLASGSKSFVGIAAAAAVEDGLLKLDDPACSSILEWKEDPKKNRITYHQILTLTSGLTASERGFAPLQAAWKDTAASPMTGTPGQQFNYGASQLNVFAYALERLLVTETFEAYLDRRVLRPLDIAVEWRIRCKDGHPQVGGGGFITSRDWATFGEFIRWQGKFGDKQIINSELIAKCFKGTEQNPAYGETWWLKNVVTPEIRHQIPILSLEWADVANADWSARRILGSDLLIL